jgi:peptide/nickel transport system substrate-binding protein
MRSDFKLISRKGIVTISLLLLFAASTLVALLGSPAVVEASSPSQGGTLVMALPNAIDTFNQLQTNAYQAWYFNQLMYPDNGVPASSGLVHVAVQNYWANTNATAWYFRVTPGVTWSDGVPANATDLAFSLRVMFSTYPKWGGSTSLAGDASLLNGNITTAIKIDNSSVVEVDFKQPFGLFGDIAGTENTPNFTPEHIWSSLINNTAAPPRNFGTVVGAGPFYVSNFHQGDQQITLLPNTYGTPWGGNSKGVPYLSQIVVQLVPSSSSLAVLLQGGQVDAAQLAPSDVAGILSNPNIQVSATNGTGLWYIEFPGETYPYNMSAFRQAMAYGIDKNALVTNALAGYGSPASSAFIPPSNSPEYNSSVPSYAFNPNMSQSLLKGLGFKMGSDGYYTLPNGTSFQPPVYVPSEQTEIVLAGTLVVRDLQSIGIDAQLRSIATTSMSSIWYQGINMYFEEQNFGYPNSELLTDESFYSTFTTAGPTQTYAFANNTIAKEYNATVAQLDSAGDQNQRYQLEQKIEGIVGNYLPSIPLFYPDFIWGFNKASFGGWPTAPSSFELPGAVFNLTALADVYQISSAQSSSASTLTTTASPVTTTVVVTSTGSATTETSSVPVTVGSTVTAVITTTATTSTSSDTTLYAAIALIVVIIVIAAAVMATKRKR